MPIRPLHDPYARINPPPRRRKPPATRPPDDAPAAADPPPTRPSPTGGATAAPDKPTKSKQAHGAPNAHKVKRQPTGDYPVGNCRPPGHGQIKPGEVRNPRGRPRGAKGLNTIVRTTMDEKLIVRTARGEKRMSRIEAAFHRQVERAFGGSDRAMAAVMTSYRAAVPDQQAEDAGHDASTAESDEAIIAAFREMLTMGEPAADDPQDDDASDAAEENDDE